MATKAPKAPKAEKPVRIVAPPPARRETKREECTAADTGHAACQCGGPHCGCNITG